VAAASDGSERESRSENKIGDFAAGLDLLDPEAAEASRLVPEAQNWEGEEEESSAFEARPTVRVTPTIAAGAADEGESDDESIGAEGDEDADEGDLDDESGEETEHDNETEHDSADDDVDEEN
jgi:hypothetical protein